ncbi:MAG: AraC family transcriptional regulator [Methylacidiphilales bacterium]|nr:AraC family transcriptional regulator [Candidatus Methylacidiphilales bacterium]
MKKTRRAKELVLSQLLKELKKSKQRLEDVPAAVLREAQKRGFPDMRAAFLPPPGIRRSLRQPLLRDLLVTRIGYCSRAAGHYIPRPEGSMDHILHYCVGGRGWLSLSGRRWDVAAGTAFLLPRGVPHIYGADTNDPWSIYWIHFTGRQADEFFEILQVSAERPLLNLPCTEEILSALRLVETHMAGGHERFNLIAASTALAGFLGLIHLRQSVMKQRERTTEENIQETIDFMRANLARPISLRELAQLAHMSVSRYETAFTRSTGCSSIHYFNRMKIEKACRLLSETQLPAKTICAEIGYEDPYYFSRLFKKMVGVSPAYYRNPARSRLSVK